MSVPSIHILLCYNTYVVVLIATVVTMIVSQFVTTSSITLLIYTAITEIAKLPQWNIILLFWDTFLNYSTHFMELFSKPQCTRKVAEFVFPLIRKVNNKLHWPDIHFFIAPNSWEGKCWSMPRIAVLLNFFGILVMPTCKMVALRKAFVTQNFLRNMHFFVCNINKLNSRW